MSQSSSAPGEMHLLEHLSELRRRVIRAAIAVSITTIAAYGYSHDIFLLLADPFGESFGSATLIGTGPAEAFMLRMSVSFFAGVIIAVPLIFWEVWQFVKPGLYENERRLVIPFMLIASALFFLGVWFCFKVILPISFQFFKEQYELIGVTPQIKMSENLSLITKAMLGFGVAFEMPILAFFLGRSGLINDRMMIDGSRYAIIGILIIAAILTPPDVVSQMLLAVPLLALYGISIMVVRYSMRSKVRAEGAKLENEKNS